jgi:uncharacterized protein (TIGR00369 family)
MRQDRSQAPDSGASESVGPLGDALGITVAVREPGHSRMVLQVDPGWHNPNGVVHGGLIYTLIDYSMGGAVSAGLAPEEYCTSIEVKVSYLSSVREGTLTAETHVFKEGRTIAFVESKVHDQSGRLVATGSGSMFIFRSTAKGRD